MAEVTGLNWLRGITALLVLVSHARGFFFADFGDLAQPAGLPDKAFYLVTGLGGGAVMIFFVLSGYLVAGSVHQSVAENRFGWRPYLVARLTRLWTVLVPCLILTLIADLVALTLFHAPFHTGALGAEVTSAPDSAISLGALTFLGNLAFVQTVAVPVYGSNGPLWSIANEFWYYLLFPLVFLAVTPQARRNALWGIPLAVILMIGLGRDIVQLFPVWLLGYAAWRLKEARLSRYLRSSAPAAIGVVCGLIALLLITRVLQIQAGLSGLYLIGLATALALPALHHPLFATARPLANGIANVSFSLYLSHFPVLALLAAAQGSERAMALSEGMPLFAIGVILSFAVATVIYLAAERHHLALRRFVLRQMGRLS